MGLDGAYSGRFFFVRGLCGFDFWYVLLFLMVLLVLDDRGGCFLRLSTKSFEHGM